MENLCERHGEENEEDQEGVEEPVEDVEVVEVRRSLDDQTESVMYQDVPRTRILARSRLSLKIICLK